MNKPYPPTKWERLGRMIDCAAPFPPLTAAPIGGGGGMKVHQMAKGTSLSWPLLSQEEISAARWFCSAGTVFPTHAHKQREWLIVYIGSVWLTVGNEDERRLLPGTSVVIEQGIEHAKRFTEDTWYLAVTIPESEDWPKCPD